MARKSRNNRELKDIFKDAWEDIYDALNIVQASRDIESSEQDIIDGIDGCEESFFESSRQFNFFRLKKRVELFLLKPIVMPVLTILSLPFELAYHAYINFKPFSGPRDLGAIAEAVAINKDGKEITCDVEIVEKETWGAYLYSKLPSKPTMSWLFNNKNKEVQQQGQTPIMLSQPTTQPISLSTPTNKQDRDSNSNSLKI